MIDREFNNIAWSYSKRDLLRQCLRRYYFNYYGANKKTAKDEERKGQINFLKSLTNRYMRTGEILHLAIRTYFKNNNMSGNSNNGLIKWATNIFRNDIKYSTLNEYERKNLEVKYKPSLLLEYFYEQENFKQKCQESLERMENALSNFVNNPEIAKLRQLTETKDSIIEKRVNIKNKNFNASGKIDFSVKKDGKIYIIDWKIGSEEFFDESLQLAFYGLWAMHEYQYEPENIKLFKICLSDFKIVPFPFDIKIYYRTKACLIQDIEKIHLLDNYGKNANFNVFSKCNSSRICELCPYQGICREELES